jgi:hypothetical protein
VPTIYRRARFKMVATPPPSLVELRRDKSLCPTLRSHAPRTDLLCAQARFHAAACDQLARRANHFGFSEIASSPRIKNILLSFSRKSSA